jgi:hypothetical protein
MSRRDLDFLVQVNEAFLKSCKTAKLYFRRVDIGRKRERKDVLLASNTQPPEA